MATKLATLQLSDQTILVIAAILKEYGPYGISRFDSHQVREAVQEFYAQAFHIPSVEDVKQPTKENY